MRKIKYITLIGFEDEMIVYDRHAFAKLTHSLGDFDESETSQTVQAWSEPRLTDIKEARDEYDSTDD
jgi:hypothetical protein